MLMALNNLLCADVPLRNYSLKVTPLFNAEYLRNGTRYRVIIEILIEMLKGVISNDLE